VSAWTWCNATKQEVILVFVGLVAADDVVGHAAGHGHLLGEFFLGLDDGVFDLVGAFDFDDEVGAVGLLDEEVRVVAARDFEDADPGGRAWSCSR
jgi:hypothetical protein